ncbi:MAG: hypothetical protein MJ237_07980 [bacterium]|nr:hypothetical protein [bacterium]
MKQILLITLLLSFLIKVSADTGLPPLKDAQTWYPPEKTDNKPKDSYWKVMLYRANKVHPSDSWRYYYHITNREYLDCTYYKHVNCEDIRFCRCWQCKDYVYNFGYKE